MKASLISFETGLKDLRRYLQGIEIESKLLAINFNKENASESDRLISHFQEHTLESIASKKRFNYNTIIVSLYGYLEQFIESIITAYVGYLNDVFPDFYNLPDPIIKNHIDLSFGLISRIDQKYHRKRFDPKQVIYNLNSCNETKDRYRINAEAFAQHTANFRVEIIDDLFIRVGINKVSQLLQKNSIFKKYLNKKYPDHQLKKLEPKAAFYHLNDLAERRNQVAHGTITDDILSNDLILDYIDFFEAYGPALYDALNSSTFPYIIEQHGVELGKPIEVYNNSIVCLELINIAVKVGDKIFAKPATSSEPYREGSIQELEIDHIKYKNVEAHPAPLNVAMKVDFKAKRNQTFYILSETPY